MFLLLDLVESVCKYIMVDILSLSLAVFIVIVFNFC